MAPIQPAPQRAGISIDSLMRLPRELLPTLQALPQRLPQLHPRDALPSLHDLLSSRSLPPQKRQYSTVAIPSVYQGVRPNSGSAGPGTGAVVGIVLGSVAGFVLIVWLLWTLANYQNRESAVVAESVEVVRERPLRRRSRSPRSRRSRRSRRETVVVRERTRSPRAPSIIVAAAPPPPVARETIIVEERRRESAPPPPMPPPPPADERRETIFMSTERVRREESRVHGDDMVEVFEENSVSDVRSPPPPPRRESRRTSRRSSAGGGYRSVDPHLFGGGDYPQHRMHRDRSISTRS